MTIFPPLLRLLHFSTAWLRLGHDLGVVSSSKIPKKGLEGKTWPKRRRFGPKNPKKNEGFSTLSPLQPDAVIEEEKKKKKKKEKENEEGVPGRRQPRCALRA